MDWNTYPTFEATPMPRPQAKLTALPDNAWHLQHPEPLQAYQQDAVHTHPLCWIDALKRRSLDDTAMMCQRDTQGNWRSISWSQMWRTAQTLASALLQLGYSQHTPIATLSSNSLELAALKFAAMLANVPLVHVSPAYSLHSKSYAQINAIWGVTQPHAVFVQNCEAYAGALAYIQARSPNTQVFDASSVSWATLCEQANDPSALDHIHYNDTDTCAIYFTSGSTGSPKGVAISHGMLTAQLMMVRTLYYPEQRSPIVTLDWLPWHHVFAGISTLSRLLELGGTYYIDEGKPLQGQFEATLRNLRTLSPTFYSSTPLAFSKLIPALEQDHDLAQQFFSKLEFLGYGGASLARDSWERIQRLAIKYRGQKLAFLSGFGTTESAATGMALYWPSDDTAVIGLPYPGVELKLVPLQDDDTQRYELRMRGPHMFTGYLGAHALNTSVFDEQGYYKLGDAVRFADPNNPLRGLRFAGRVSENFKLSSGTWVNASALRLQAISLLSPFAIDCVVCGRDLDYLALLIWPNETALRALSPDLAALNVEQLVQHPAVVLALQNKLTHAANLAGTNATTFMRAAFTHIPPSIDAGEITDKGYINQQQSTHTRSQTIASIYSSVPPSWVALNQTF